MSNFNYCGWAGNQKFEWHFENPEDKLKVIDGVITEVTFGHRPMYIYTSLTRFYNERIKGKKDPTASHSFAKMKIKARNQDELIVVYVDYDGSVHVSGQKEYENGTEKLFPTTGEVNYPLMQLVSELTEDIPKYHHFENNCKKFCEKVCAILLGEASTQAKYLSFLHRNRKV
jgi:hypothetical protein